MRQQENLTILKALKNGTASKAALKTYSGWGGLKEAIYTPSFYRAMKKVLTDEEILSIKKTLHSAYYTPQPIIQFICQALAKMGDQGGDVLEPAAGIGSFIDSLTSLHPKTITAVELDGLSAKILSILYPCVKTINAPFQNTDLGKFDLIIGNPPFGRESIIDNNHLDLAHLKIHHYFAAKCVRMLNPNGLLAMVLPAYFMDNRRDHAREIIAKDSGELVAAFRLPEDCFKNAKVTVDIVFIKKGKTGVAWQKIRSLRLEKGVMPMNEYFFNHPDHVLGRLAIADIYDRQGLVCQSSGNTFEQLHAMLAHFPSTNDKRCDLTPLKALDNRIGQVKMKMQTLQTELQYLTDYKEQIDGLHQQINCLLAKAVT